jgi:DNA invertase Pin-like site-specific DNA recombinase
MCHRAFAFTVDVLTGFGALSYIYVGLHMTTSSRNPKNSGKFVAYYRVSTDRQGRSGLGLEAQRKAVVDWLEGAQRALIAEFTEVESGKKSDRPELEKAFKECKRRGATLVIARLDRLARNVHFISGLMERKVPFVAVEFPDATPVMLHIHAAMAEHERKLISERTTAGLERAKARGVKLGAYGRVLARRNRNQATEQARELRPVIEELRKAGKTTVRELMQELNRRGIRTLRGGAWHPHTVNVLLHRIDQTKPKARVLDGGDSA